MMNMKDKKMSKEYFFQTIEERLKDLEKEVEEMKKGSDFSDNFDKGLAKENIIFGRVLELNTINSAAMKIDYGKYSELDNKIRELMNKI